MAHDETIRIYRSDAIGAEPPSLTYGELAANLTDRKLFIGGPGGTANMMVIRETPINTGVTSFNGATGAVVYTPPVASAGASGVASFSSTDFTVSGTGHVSFQGSLFTLRDEIGGSDSIAKGETLTITGGTGIDFVRTSKNNFAIRGVTATSSVLGVASFPASFFSVSNGAVSLSGPYSIIGVTGVSAGHTGISLVGTTGNVQIWNMGVHTFNGATGHITFNPVTGNTVLAGSGIAIPTSVDNTRTIINIGVTGISAGHTGIALSGTTGNVQIWNMGVHTFNGSTGHITFNPATGDTITAGLAIGVSVISGNNKRIDNLGVTSFNGLTGAVTLTGDSGAIIGASNNTITARIATSGTTGVASFPASFFSVSNGAVSLSGPYSIIGVTGIGFGNDAGLTGKVNLTAGTSITFDLLANNTIRINSTGVVGATGDTVVAGVGTSVVRSGNQVTVNNMGVTSFNGLTGAVTLTGDGGAIIGATNNTIRARLATESLTGVASFPATFFAVNNGAVSLSGPYGIIGVTGVTTGPGISVSGTTGNVRISNMGVTSFNGLTGTVVYAPSLATAGASGVASFLSTHFSVSNTGHVSLATPYTITGNTVVAGSGISIPTSADNSRTIINIGVTGISAGHTGIALSGTTGNVQVFNMGVLSLDGQTGHLTRGSTGDTISAGLAIGVSVVSGNNKRIDNLGVTSFNGLTGAVTLTGDGAAIIGAANNIIRARLATESLTGVASFPASFFSVSNGAVSLSGSYGIIGVTGVTAGSGISLSGITGNVRISNMGVTSFNGLTGAVSYAPPLATTTGTTGVAAFNNQQFSISNGTVSIPDVSVSVIGSNGAIGILNTVGVVAGDLTITGSSGIRTLASGGGSALVEIFNTGVTGISAGHTGIALSGTTGNVQVFNMGVLSLDGQTGHLSRGATGDTITAGLAIGVSVVSGNNKRIDNLGVTSFNGLTGAVTLTGDGGAVIGAGNNRIIARLVTSGTTGIASFNTDHFSVSSSTGHVSLASAYTATGDTVITVPGSGIGISTNGRTDTLFNIGVTGISAGHTGIALSSTTGNVQIFNMGVLSINGQTGHYTLPAAGATGDTVVAGVGVSVVRSDNQATVNNMGVTSFNGATGTVVYAPSLATAGASGVASFLATDFSVSNTGHVSLSSRSVTVNTNAGSGLAGGSSVNLGGSLTLTNIGVTGISAGHTGIALSGITGNVRIFNMGVHTFNGSTGHITFNPATGDTVVAGVGISAVRSNNQVTVNNMGVTSFNGATGTVVYAPPVAAAGASGVASFPTTDFGVSTTGVVSLTGNVPRTNQLNTFTASQQFSGGFVVNAGATFNSTIAALGNITTSGTVLGSNTFRWESITANRSLSANYGVFANKVRNEGQLGLTMASSSGSFGTIIRVTGITGSWRITLDDNQKIHFGNVTAQTTPSAYAYLESTHHRDSIEMVCLNSGQNLEWNVLSSVGIIDLGTVSRLGEG